MPSDLAARLDALQRKLAARGVRLGPPRGEDELVAFERRHGVALPPDYREFLRRVGDGGDGPPLHGLYPFGHVPEDSGTMLARPFPCAEETLWEDDPDAEPPALDGCLVLGTEGCGLDWVLVVTGPERGQIWQTSDVGAAPADPPSDFLTWYEDWLATRA